ncbi:MAG: PA2169 family four-helix-bundle protein [Terriglobales bacterium]
MAQDNTISIVEKLIETCRDGEKGYQDAAAHVKRPDLKSYFEAQSAERRRFAMELQAELSKLGKPGKKESGSVSAALHRAWIDTKANLGAGDKSILDSVEQGEDRAKAAYEETLIGPTLDVSLATLVQRQAERVKTAHDKVRSMRDQLAA